MPCIKGSPIEQDPKTAEEIKQLMDLSTDTHLKKRKFHQI